MLRKDFIRLTALASSYFATTAVDSDEISFQPHSSFDLSVSELQQYLVSLTKLKPETVDRIIIGDPETKVKKNRNLLDAWLEDLQTSCRIGSKCAGYT